MAHQENNDTSTIEELLSQLPPLAEQGNDDTLTTEELFTTGVQFGLNPTQMEHVVTPNGRNVLIVRERQHETCSTKLQVLFRTKDKKKYVHSFEIDGEMEVRPLDEFDENIQLYLQNLADMNHLNLFSHKGCCLSCGKQSQHLLWQAFYNRYGNTNSENREGHRLMNEISEHRSTASGTVCHIPFDPRLPQYCMHIGQVCLDSTKCFAYARQITTSNLKLFLGINQTSKALVRCSGPGCSKTDSNGEFGLCTCCKIRAFCSDGCAKQAWNVYHKAECVPYVTGKQADASNFPNNATIPGKTLLKKTSMSYPPLRKNYL